MNMKTLQFPKLLWSNCVLDHTVHEIGIECDMDASVSGDIFA